MSCLEGDVEALGDLEQVAISISSLIDFLSRMNSLGDALCGPDHRQ